MPQGVIACKKMSHSITAGRKWVVLVLFQTRRSENWRSIGHRSRQLTRAIPETELLKGSTVIVRSKASYLASVSLDYAMADSIMNELGQRMEAKLERNFRSVRLYSPDADSQQRSDLLVRLSLRQKADDFNLARSCSGTSPIPLVMVASCFEKPV